MLSLILLYFLGAIVTNLVIVYFYENTDSVFDYDEYTKSIAIILWPLIAFLYMPIKISYYVISTWIWTPLENFVRYLKNNPKCSVCGKRYPTDGFTNKCIYCQD